MARQLKQGNRPERQAAWEGCGWKGRVLPPLPSNSWNGHPEAGGRRTRWQGRRGPCILRDYRRKKASGWQVLTLTRISGLCSLPLVQPCAQHQVTYHAGAEP